MRTRWLVLLVLALALAGAATLLASCTSIKINEGDVFLPKPSITPASFAEETFGEPGLRFEEVFIPVPAADDASADSTAADSLRLNGWHLMRPGARGTVVLFGGNGFYLVQSRGYVEALTRLPVNVFLWDYRGYGQSGGSPSVAGFKRDALAVVDWLAAERGVAPSRMVVHGHSLGTFLATYVATERDVAGVVLENPATSVDGWIDALTPWFASLFVRFEVDERLRVESNLDRVRQVEAPLLVVGGKGDEVTPPAMARELHEAAVASFKALLVLDGGHNGLYEQPAFRGAYRDLLGRAFGASGEAAPRSPADATRATPAGG
jgi:hypothetical protein